MDKTCAKCGETKGLEEFYRRLGKRRARCKVCHDADNAGRAHRWKIANTKRQQGHNLWCRYRRRQRLPKWADKQAILKFYEDRPDGMHVDHILPLNGATVSGLHVLANLQYLTPSENKKKGNRV